MAQFLDLMKTNDDRWRFFLPLDGMDSIVEAIKMMKLIRDSEVDISDIDNGFIYVVANSNLLKEIHVFKLDLVLIRRFSTKPYQPWSTTELSNKLYVGTEEGIILVYKNEKITSQFNGCDGNSVLLASILFDPNGYMATTFSNPSTMYLFSQNGSFTGIVPY